MVQRKVKKRVKKKLNINKFRKLLIIAVLVYFSLMSIPALRTSNIKTIPVEKGTVIDSVKAQGMILKNENIYKAQTKGNVLFFQEEGAKLGRGVKVAEISNATYEDYKEEIKEIDSEIEKYNDRMSSQKEVLKDDIKKNQEEIDSIVKEVQKNVAEQNYEQVKKLKDKLLIISDKKDAISSEKTLISEQIDRLIKKKSGIINKMKQSSLIYYTEKSGIISNTLDGLENRYSSRNIEKYTIEDLNKSNIDSQTIKNKQQVKIGESIFKIIEDQVWYVMTKIEDDSLKGLKKGNKISVSFDKHKDEIEGTIVKLDKSEKEKFIIIKFDKYVHEFYNYRYIDLKLIKNTKTGMKIPKKSIVNKDGQKGVFIKDISGVVKFRPINILIETENIIIVEPATQEESLQLYDEVFTEGNKVKEGQIVNYKGGD